MADTNTKVAICGAFSKFLESADLADFTVVCRGTHWHVHRFVLSVHSSVLGKACDGDFKETRDAKIDLSEHDKAHTDALVKYLYTFDYTTENDADHSSQMCFHANMCIVADKYDIGGLKQLSVEKFNSIIGNTKTSSELVDAACLAYEAALATTGIREGIVKLIANNKDDFLASSTDNDTLRDCMRAYPDFAIEVITSKSPEVATQKYKCPSCKGEFHVKMNDGDFYNCNHCEDCRPARTWAQYKVK